MGYLLEPLGGSGGLVGYLLESLGDSGLGRDSNPRRDVVLSERTLSLAPRPLGHGLAPATAPLARLRFLRRPASSPSARTTPPCLHAATPAQ